MSGRLIALCGRKRSGKDFTAKTVFPDFERRAFADPLREEVERMYGAKVLASGKTLSARLAEIGWEGLKSDPVDSPEARAILQDVGVSRRQENEDYWLDLVLNESTPKFCVITDARFPNEISAVRNRGGLIVVIHNSSLGPDIDMHVSEWAWRECIRDEDFHLRNPGGVTGLLEAGFLLRRRLGI